MGWWSIFWLVMLLVCNAFFVAAEFSIMSARRSQIEPSAVEGSSRAKTTLWAMEHVSLMLACAQLGITVSSLLILQAVEPGLKELLTDGLKTFGIPYDAIKPIAVITALVIVTFLHVTLGEMVPKNLAVASASKMVVFLAPLLVGISQVVKPVIVALNWLANGILLLFKVKPKNEVSSAFTREQVGIIVRESAKQGLVEDDAGLLASALEFREHTVKDMVVARSELHTLPDSVTPREFEQAVSRTGFSRFVLVNAQEQLVGYLHLKDIISIRSSRYDDVISRNKVRDLVSVSAADNLESSLKIMRTSGTHLARVVDDTSQQTVGVLFLEDVLEQLVGEIRDSTQQYVR